VPTGAKTTTRAAAFRTKEIVSQLLPTITFSVSAARQASSGTRQRSFATIQPTGANGKEIEGTLDMAPYGAKSWVEDGKQRWINLIGRTEKEG
jgi:hypothetical protein